MSLFIILKVTPKLTLENEPSPIILRKIKSLAVFLLLALLLLPLVDASVSDMFAIVCLPLFGVRFRNKIHKPDETKTNKNKVVTDKQHRGREADKENTHTNTSTQ